MRASLYKFYWYASVLAGTIAPPDVYAAEFSWQLSGSYEEADESDISEAHNAALTATYYFRPVDDDVGPYALAAFLNRSSRVTAAYSDDESERISASYGFGLPLQQGTFESKADGYSVTGRYVWLSSGWYVGAGVSQADTEAPFSLPLLGGSGELSGYTAELGKYLSRSTTLQLTAGSAESTTENPSSLCGGLPPSPFVCSPVLMQTETKSDDVGLAVLHAGDIRNLEYSLSGTVLSSKSDFSISLVGPLPTLTTFPGFPARPPPFAVIGIAFTAAPVPVSFDRRHTYSVAGELFPMKSLGIRLGYARWDGDPLLDESYDVSTTWYFRRNIAAQVAFGKTKRGTSGNVPDIDDVAFRLIGRL